MKKVTVNISKESYQQSQLMIQQLLADLCDSVLDNVDFDGNDEAFGGLITLQYIRDHNQELLTMLNEWSK